LPLGNKKLEELASRGTIREYKKDEVIFDQNDFPLTRFFCVKKGFVKLLKIVEIERQNFMPTSMDMYTRRTKSKRVAHCLGTVKPFQYFGVVECLMSRTSGQIPCSKAKAGEENTELIFFNTVDLVDAFTT